MSYIPKHALLHSQIKCSLSFGVLRVVKEAGTPLLSSEADSRPAQCFHILNLRYVDCKEMLCIEKHGVLMDPHTWPFFFLLKRIFFLLALLHSPYQHSGILQYYMELLCTLLSTDWGQFSARAKKNKTNKFVVRGRDAHTISFTCK